MAVLTFEFPNPSRHDLMQDLARKLCGFSGIDTAALNLLRGLSVQRGALHLAVWQVPEGMQVDKAISAVSDLDMVVADPAPQMCFLYAIERRLIVWEPEQYPSRFMALAKAKEDEVGLRLPAVTYRTRDVKDLVYLSGVDLLRTGDTLLLRPKH